MAKVLLIKSCAWHEPMTITYPLGLMYLSSALKIDGHETRMLDARLGRLGPEEIASEAAEYGPDVIGISAVYAEYQMSRRVTEELKKKLPDVPIVLGGPYPTSDPGAAVRDHNILCAVSGPGEHAFREIVELVTAGKDIGEVEGLVLRDGEGFRLTAPREQLKDVDTLPYPDWGCADIEGYGRVRRWGVRMDGRYMSLFTSRSCPYQCIYCHKIFGKGYRAHSPNRVLSEIKILNENFGIKEFEILDDTFNLDRKRVIEICDLIIGSGMKVSLSFPNAIRGDILDEEVIDKLKQAGTIGIHIAIESGVPRIQKLIKKNLDLEKARESIRLIASRKILVHGYFMLGFPTETVEEMRETVRFAARTRLHMASFMFATPVPGTELHEMVGDNSRFNYEEKEFHYYSPDLVASNLPIDTIKSIHASAFRKFYMNPLRFVRVLVAHPNKKLIMSGISQFFMRVNPKQ